MSRPRNPNWSVAEDRVALECGGDFHTAATLLPGRSAMAVKARLNVLTNQLYRPEQPGRPTDRWSKEDLDTIQACREAGMGPHLMMGHFPGRTVSQVNNAIIYYGMRRTKSFVVLGRPILDQLRQRAAKANLAISSLDRQANCGGRLARGSVNISLEKIARAAAVLGGEIKVRWDPLD